MHTPILFVASAAVAASAAIRLVNAAGFGPEGILCLTNLHRANNNLDPLRLDPDLAKLALLHSIEMNMSGRMSHNGIFPETSTWTKRLTTFYPHQYKSAAENVSFNAGSWHKTFILWFKSPGHNANMLCKDCNSMGVACVGSRFYCTQSFVGLTDSVYLASLPHVDCTRYKLPANLTLS